MYQIQGNTCRCLDYSKVNIKDFKIKGILYQMRNILEIHLLKDTSHW